MTDRPSIPPLSPPPATLAAPPKRRWWPTLLLALLVFFAGTGFGVAATVIVVLRRVEYAIQHPDQAPIRLARQLKNRLGLDPSQTAAVEKILTTRQKRLQNIRGKLQPQVDQEMEDARNEITNVLRPDQRQKWNVTYDEIKSNWLPPPPSQ